MNGNEMIPEGDGGVMYWETQGMAEQYFRICPYCGNEVQDEMSVCCGEMHSEIGERNNGK